jgi:SAM-dependent methyltransferase
MEISPKRLKSYDFARIQNALVDFYTERPEEYGIMERPQEVYEEYARFISLVVQNKNSKILDLGSGSWRIPDTIAQYGFKEVIGLDYFSDHQYNDYQKRLKNSNAKLMRYEEMNKLPFEDSSFAAVSSLCVFEHIVYIEDFLCEIDRVLQPNGYVIFQCPNWSGVNAMINGLFHTIFKKDRFWQLNSPIDAFLGIFRSFWWYFENLFSRKPIFIRIYPRMLNGKVNFERSDDDAVHLCQPLSIKKYFKQKGYKTIIYNRGYGTTLYTKIFNRIFPSLASTNVLVFQKGGNKT